MKFLLLACCAALWAACYSPAADSPGLKTRITPIERGHPGKVAVAVKHLGTGEEFYLDADAPMPTASLIKLAMLVETYAQEADKKLDLGTTLTLTKDDKVPGAGVLTYHFSDGATFPLRDAVRLMVVYSDNTATNMVVDKISIKAVNDRMAGLGLKETRLNSKVYKRSTSSVDLPRSEKYGLGSTTARETMKLLEMIYANKVVTPDACKAMLGHLKANDDNEMLVRFLPPGVTAYHKTGAVSNARTDAGILTWKDKDKKEQAVAICVLTNENKDERYVIDNAAQLAIANIAKEVVAHFQK